MAGRDAEARVAVAEAISLATKHGERGHLAWALRARAEAEARNCTDDPEGAAESFRAALARAGELEMHPLVAHCHFGLAKHYRHTGTYDRARGDLASATTMFREMDMRFWLEQAEAERMKTA